MKKKQLEECLKNNMLVAVRRSGRHISKALILKIGVRAVGDFLLKRVIDDANVSSVLVKIRDHGHDGSPEEVVSFGRVVSTWAEHDKAQAKRFEEAAQQEKKRSERRKAHAVIAQTITEPLGRLGIRKYFTVGVDAHGVQISAQLTADQARELGRKLAALKRES